MQITDTPLKFIAGILTPPQAGIRQHHDPAPQAKANGQPTTAGARPAIGAVTTLLRLGGGETLDEAVHTLRAEGRLPQRGSLLDIRA